MKWMIVAIAAELGVLLCLIFGFDGALHSVQTMRPTWDHAAVFVIYGMVRVGFSRVRAARPSTAAPPAQLSRAA